MAFITSTGEPTTELCRWSLDRLGFHTILYIDDSSLWNKLDGIFEEANEDFLRVDADVVVNKNVLDLVAEDKHWWYQAQTFDWFKQDVTNGGIQFIRKQAIPVIREHINEAKDQERPESHLYRLEAFHSPRRCVSYNTICGIHGYKQSDVNKIRETKLRRGQFENYDWELADRLSAL